MGIEWNGNIEILPYFKKKKKKKKKKGCATVASFSNLHNFVSQILFLFTYPEKQAEDAKGEKKQAGPANACLILSFPPSPLPSHSSKQTPNPSHSMLFRSSISSFLPANKKKENKRRDRRHAREKCNFCASSLANKTTPNVFHASECPNAIHHHQTKASDLPLSKVSWNEKALKPTTSKSPLSMSNREVKRTKQNEKANSIIPSILCMPNLSLYWEASENPNKHSIVQEGRKNVVFLKANEKACQRKGKAA